MTEEIQKDKKNSQALLFVDRLMDTVDIVVGQVTSGRWILTVISGVCLIHIAWSSDDKTKIVDIIKDIIIFYFVVRDTSSSKIDKPINGGPNVPEDKTVVSKPIQQSSSPVV